MKILPIEDLYKVKWIRKNDFSYYYTDDINKNTYSLDYYAVRNGWVLGVVIEGKSRVTGFTLPDITLQQMNDLANYIWSKRRLNILNKALKQINKK
jgi:hypothetical protein